MRKTFIIFPLLGVVVLAISFSIYLGIKRQNNSIREVNTPEYSGKKLGIGYLPTIQSLPLFVAKKKGFFAEQGLNIDLIKFNSSQEAVAASLAGDIDLFVSGAIPVINSFENTDLDLRMIVAATSKKSKNDKYSSDFLLGQKSIKTVAELKGKKIGVLNDPTGRVLLSEVLPKYGLTIDDVTLIVLTPKQQVNSFNSNAIDALLAQEPIIASTIFKYSKSTTLINGFTSEIHSNFTSSGIWINTSSLGKETQKKIHKALTPAIWHIDRDKEKTIKVLLDYTDIPVELLDEIRLPNFELSYDYSATLGFQAFINLFSKNGIFETNFAAIDWMWSRRI